MNTKPDPTGLSPTKTGVRPADHERQGDGATRDSEALRAYRRAIARRKKATDRTALRVGLRRQP